MKNSKKWIVVLLIVGIILTTGCTQNQSTKDTTNLTESAARQIALEKAGLETATFTKQEYDAEDNDYEFEFQANGKEYDCEVNAADGNIKNYSVENIEFLDN